MMESIGKYLTSVAAAAILCGVIEKLNPKGRTAGSMIKMLCGIFMVLTAVNPWMKLPVYDFAAYAQSFSREAEEAKEQGSEAALEYKRRVITEKVSAYILDKAAQLELDIAVEVILTEDAQCVPCGVEITGTVPEAKKLQLEHILEAELGIGRSNQIWSG